MSPRHTPKPRVKRVLSTNTTETITRKEAAALLRSWHNAAKFSGYELNTIRTTSGTEYQFSGRRTYPSPLFVQRAPVIHKRPTGAKPSLAAAYGVSATATMQELADGQRRRIAEGLSYGYRLERGVTPAQVMALMEIKDMLRKVRMAAVVDPTTGCIVFVNRDGELHGGSKLAYSAFL